MSHGESYDFSIKQNDTAPALESTLQQGGVDYDLTGATVRFHMTKRGGDQPKVDAAAIVEDVAGGQVKYEWQASDTNEAGVYECEWEVINPDNSETTFPSDGYFTVHVVADLA